MFVLIATLLVATVAFAPARVLADPLTPSQIANVQQMATAYYRAAVSGDAMTFAKVTTPHYQVIGVNGQPVSQAALAGALAKLNLNASRIEGHVTVDSASATAGVVTANVTVHGTAYQTAGGAPGVTGGSKMSSISKHVLTFVKSPSGNWLVQKDVVLKASRG
ncbi:MAG TPA: hypothetical protein VGP41_01895 [Candidatus Lustribacter sp.]|nr:hypothetical protein [Candidatus Lustribacter sp.]